MELIKLEKLTRFINSSQSTSPLVTKKIQALNLKINQQLEVKIISSEKNSQTLVLQASQSSKPIHVKTNTPFESKQGQTLQLLITQILPALEFEVLKTALESKQLNTKHVDNLITPKNLLLKQFFPTSDTKILKQQDDTKPASTTIPLIISAKIISIDADKIQLKISGQEIITVNKDQLSQVDSKQHRIEVQNFKVGQTIQLEVNTKSSIKTDFKLIDTNIPKLTVGQNFSAKVIEIKGSSIQLQLKPIPHLAKFPQNKIDSPSSIIILNKNQLLPTSIQPSSSHNLLPPLKIGQQIQFEVVKTGSSPMFKLVDAQPTNHRLNQQVIDTIKQVLPIQTAPTELINQLIISLPKIKNSESISDNLKRLAKEILESLPKLKNTRNPQQLKSAITNSGLFLEAKLATSPDETKNNFPTDFKNKLLKFQHALKQELEVKNNQKTASNELNLLKEMQQKTENSLARVILNQLNSLPKEEGAKQMWLLDLPFINKETAESVKIEIDREQHSTPDENEENWAVTLTITPPGLATIHCKISCLDKIIHTRFWSDSQGVVDKISHNLDYLEKQLKAEGLETGHLSAHRGIDTKNSHQQITPQNLLDQKV
jgi:hypothetical protein